MPSGSAQRRTERLVEDHREQLAHRRPLGGQAEECGGVLGATDGGRRVQRREVVVVVRAQRPAQSGVDLRLGQRPLHRLEHRPAEVEVVVRELEVEERALPLLELRRRGQHVVGTAGGLGERDVDHHHQVERVEGLAHPLAVGDRVDGVAGLDEQGPEPVGMIGQDLVGDHVARHEPGDEAVAGHGVDGSTPPTARVDFPPTSAAKCVCRFIPPGTPKLPVSSTISFSR